MEGWWTLVLFGAVVPAGILAALPLLERPAGEEDRRSAGTRRVGTGDRHRWGRAWRS
jgi:hypothetical protein